jgi:hypothetical protein
MMKVLIVAVLGLSAQISNATTYLPEDQKLFDALHPKRVVQTVSNARQIALAEGTVIGEPLITSSAFISHALLSGSFLGAMLERVQDFSRSHTHIKWGKEKAASGRLQPFEVTEVYRLVLAGHADPQTVMVRALVRPKIDTISSSTAHILDGRHLRHNTSFGFMRPLSGQRFSRRQHTKRWVCSRGPNASILTLVTHRRRQQASSHVIDGAVLRGPIGGVR